MKIFRYFIFMALALLIMGMPFFTYASSVIDTQQEKNPNQKTTEISWKNDIRPTLEALICVNADQFALDKKNNVYSIAIEKKGSEGLFLMFWSGIPGIFYSQDKEKFGKNCQGWEPDPQDPILRKIADIFLAKRHVIAQLSCEGHWKWGFDQGEVLDVLEKNKSGITVSAPIGIVLVEDRTEKGSEWPKEAKSVWEHYYQVLFSRQNVLQVLMPSIHAFLEAEGINCPDCPGPTEGYKPQNISLSDLIPYLAQSYQLTSLPTSTKASFNHLPIDQAENPYLALAAQALVTGNLKLMERVRILARKVMRKKEFKKGMKQKPVNEKITFLNSKLADILAKDKKFLSQSLKWAKIILAELNIECKDCIPKK